MLFKPDCIPCILNMSLSTMRRLELDEKIIEGVYRDILEIPALQGHYWNITNEEVVELVFKKIMEEIDSTDPFYEEKLKQNKMILEIYPGLKQSVNAAPNPLFEAVKLAIIGNSIDFMMTHKSVDTLKLIKERMEYALPEETFKEFVGKLNSTKRLLYIGDNAGEIVFDKLLIETIKEAQDVKVFFVVRSVPILNDATLKEAEFVGMDKFATVIENGIDSPLPGTFLKRCSRELRELVERADLIISKGGGNFDTLDEERKRLDMNITFMFLSKCYPYEQHFGVELSRPIMANFFERKGYRMENNG
jgi:uncharacterized protein with ATP-grasp and redox domains